MFTILEDLGEKKDITLRGVNKELYDQFSEYRIKQGLSAGDAFTSLIYTIIRQPWRMSSPRSQDHHKRPGVVPEKICDLERLTVTKEDLTAAGEKTMFLFRNINELIFDKDVDSTTLLKHVKVISHCNVTYRNNIPIIIQYGLTRKRHTYTHPTDKELLKDITIRNVSSTFYDEFISIAKTEGVTTGELFSRYIDNTLPFLEVTEVLHTLGDREILIVSREDSLEIKRKDLELLGDRGIIFYAIKKLVFEDDIKQELFLKAVLKIIKCPNVSLPNNIPKLIALSRAIQSN